MTSKYLPIKASKKRSLLLAMLLLCAYFLDNPRVAALMDSGIFLHVFKPALWLGLALVVWVFPRIRPQARVRFKGFLGWWAFNFGIMFIVASVLAGLINGFGKSPYDLSPKGILFNLLMIGSVLIGKELVRSYLVNSLTEEENYFIFVGLALFITLTDFTLNRYNLKGYEEGVKFVGQYFAPVFAKNLFATYLAFLGGPLPAIIYMGVIKAFEWFSPILPDLKWITAALVGILTPVFSLMAMQNLYFTEARIRVKDKEKEGTLGWVITSGISIALIWFSVGVFPYYPSVIATGSMEPMIKPGDVILVKKVKDMAQLKKNDVIQFRRDNILISHRIIEILKDKKGAKSYRTKGDNNSGPDGDLVKSEQVRGIVVQVVPKIGWPTLLIKSDKDIPLDQIEF